MSGAAMRRVVSAPATTLLYLNDGHPLEVSATVVAVIGDAIALDRTCCYPGGGGQPADRGTVALTTPGWCDPLSADRHDLVSVAKDAAGVVWHTLVPGGSIRAGDTVTVSVDRQRRRVLERYHTALHLMNAIVRRDHGGWVTGAHMAEDYARIDFALGAFPASLRGELESQVTAIVRADHPVRSFYVTDAAFRALPDLVRTREGSPPVVDGRVRVVQIEDVDMQACGGTHVTSTGGIGRLEVFGAENRGRLHKRLYVRLV